ncbi:MAG: acyl-CoA dehydrogenase family protein [Planctomycetes bacterium]|nr:acyl-CoA dehydrogenase family protein [Planctomycetota bacterium]
MSASSEHEMLVETVRDFARSELLERDRSWDRGETSCCTELGSLSQMGLLGLRVPESFGGLDCPSTVYAHIIRELAYASPSVAVTVSVHSMVCEIIHRFASDKLKAEWLPQANERENLGAFAISEPNSGSDAGAARTRAVRVPGGWKLFGSKMWVTNGMAGRWFSVLARTGETGTKKDLSMLLLDVRQPGVSRHLIHGKLGIRGSETSEMSFDGAFVPDSNLLGEHGGGMRVSLAALDGGRIGIASQAVGIGQAALDLMVEYSRQREVFGRRIAEYQAIQWMIADSKAELLAAQALIDKAAWLRDQGREFTQVASMAKQFRVEQLYRDARITTIYEGTSEVQRIVIARGLGLDASPAANHGAASADS